MGKPIKTKLRNCNRLFPDVKLGGWFQGVQTYLWFGDKTHFYGVLYGAPLLRLAKAIVRHMTDEKGGE